MPPVDMGGFDSRRGTNIDVPERNHHGQQESLTTKVTGKGQQYFIDKFISNSKN